MSEEKVTCKQFIPYSEDDQSTISLYDYETLSREVCPTCVHRLQKYLEGSSNCAWTNDFKKKEDANGD